MTHYVEFYESNSGRSPVIDFLIELSKRDKSKYIRIISIINFLDENGIDAEYVEYIKKLKKNLWEIKRDNIRVLFTREGDKIIVLLHAFIKKSQKTPKKDIETAEKRMRSLVAQRKEEKS